VNPPQSKIDELYQLPLGGFTAARNALAKTLSGDDAKRVRALEKPTLVPWAVNQIYWHARPAYERLMKAGDALRRAQIAALKGRTNDVREASETHRKAVADAVQQAAAIAAKHGSHPATDQLARMLEALSLSPSKPAEPGRLTELLQPSGFEALAGVTPAGATQAPRLIDVNRSPVPVSRAGSGRDKKRDADAERQREREAAARQKHAEAEAKAAERDRDHAKAAAARAQHDVDRARIALDAAQQALDRAQRDLQSAEHRLAAARTIQ
jgi:hypothetical protein